MMAMRFLPRLFRRPFRLGLGRVLLMAQLGRVAQSRWTAHCIENREILENKESMDRFIQEFKRENRGEALVLPEYQIELKGGKYRLVFTVDQRRTDLFGLMVEVLYELRKGDGGKDKGIGTAQRQVKVKDIESFKKGQIVTLRVEFTQFVNNRIDKGTIYLSGELSDSRPSIRFILEKDNYICENDLKAFQIAYAQASLPSSRVIPPSPARAQSPNQSLNPSPKQGSSGVLPAPKKEEESAIDMLKEMGVTVFLPGEKHDENGLQWEHLAGYEEQKRDIEDTILLSLSYPQIYSQIMAGTRERPEENRPKAVLFEGPPGTGKTTSAKIIAQQVKIPLVYMPLESVLSKYYGESEKKFSDLFEACAQLGPSIVFIDEIDALAGQRDEGMHEASRRVLSTLLRKVDGFESGHQIMLICATNRKQDLDRALLSRIDLSIEFALPQAGSRALIFKRYAKQLNQEQLDTLSSLSEGMSGRNISDVCKDTERRWASKIIRKEVEEALPDISQYIESIRIRQDSKLF